MHGFILGRTNEVLLCACSGVCVRLREQLLFTNVITDTRKSLLLLLLLLLLYVTALLSKYNVFGNAFDPLQVYTCIRVCTCVRVTARGRAWVHTDVGV